MLLLTVLCWHAFIGVGHVSRHCWWRGCCRVVLLDMFVKHLFTFGSLSLSLFLPFQLVFVSWFILFYAFLLHCLSWNCLAVHPFGSVKVTMLEVSLVVACSMFDPGILKPAQKQLCQGLLKPATCRSCP